MIKLKEVMAKITQRSESIESGKAAEIVGSECKQWLSSWKTSDPIYRGIDKHFDKYYLSDPSFGSPRQSKGFKGLEMESYYMIHILNSEKWKKFPDRSRSLICTSSPTMAAGFGKPFVVIPFDNAHIAHLDVEDIWSFPLKKYRFSLRDLNKRLELLNDAIHQKPIYDYNDLIDFYEHVDYMKDDLESMGEGRNDVIRYYIESDKTMYEYVDDILNPIGRVSDLTYKPYFRYANKRLGGIETWTDSKCVLIDTLFFDRFMRENFKTKEIK